MSDLPDKRETAFLREAWVAAQMERTKQILTLSAGAIAFLVTLLTTFGATTTQLVIYGSSALAFTCSLAAAIFILERNPKKIEKVFKGKRERDALMDTADWIRILGFGIGVALTLAVGTLYVVNPPPKSDTIMANETDKETSQNRSNGENKQSNSQIDERRSFSNIGNLRPEGNDSSGDSDTANGGENAGSEE